MSDDDSQKIIEHFDDKFAGMVEAMETIIENRVRPIVQEELGGVKQDLKTIKTAVQDTNRDVRELDERVSRLEATQ